MLPRSLCVPKVSSFLVASSKPWHKSAFENFVTRQVSDNWAYVSTTEKLVEKLRESQPIRYIFFLHWSWKVPRNIIDSYECVCFHMTNLPYGRGGSPLQNLILDGKTETAVTAFRMVEEMDAGPIYAKKTMSLAGRAEEIYRRGGDLCWEMIDWIVRTEPTPQPQAGQVTIFKRRTPSDSAMPESGNMTDIYNFIRMLDAPTYPQAFIDHGDFRYEFDCAEILNDEIRARVLIRRKTGE